MRLLETFEDVLKKKKLLQINSKLTKARLLGMEFHQTQLLFKILAEIFELLLEGAILMWAISSLSLI